MSGLPINVFGCSAPPASGRQLPLQVLHLRNRQRDDAADESACGAGGGRGGGQAQRVGAAAGQAARRLRAGRQRPLGRRAGRAPVGAPGAVREERPTRSAGALRARLPRAHRHADPAPDALRRRREAVQLDLVQVDCRATAPASHAGAPGSECLVQCSGAKWDRSGEGFTSHSFCDLPSCRFLNSYYKLLRNLMLLKCQNDSKMTLQKLGSRIHLNKQRISSLLKIR